MSKFQVYFLPICFLYTFYSVIMVILYSSPWHSKMFPCLQFQSLVKDPESWWQNMIITCRGAAKWEKIRLHPILSLGLLSLTCNHISKNSVTLTSTKKLSENYFLQINPTNNINEESKCAVLHLKTNIT